MLEDTDRFEGMTSEEMAQLHEEEAGLGLDVTTWVPPGPVSRAFFNDDTSRMLALMGPVAPISQWLDTSFPNARQVPALWR